MSNNDEKYAKDLEEKIEELESKLNDERIQELMKYEEMLLYIMKEATFTKGIDGSARCVLIVPNKQEQETILRDMWILHNHIKNDDNWVTIVS